MANAITLTFAGDATSLERAAQRSASALGDVDRAARDAGEGFDKAGEAADNVDTKAMGFRDTLTGVQDSMAGVAALSKGPSFEGFLLLGAGIGDLGSGLYNTIIPGLKAFAASALYAKIQAVALATWSGIVAAATKAWAAVQWVLNAAMSANPIGLIILAILALIGVIILIATKTTWFQTIWKAVWGGIKAAALAVWNWLSNSLWPGIRSIFDKVAGAVTSIPKKIWEAFKGLFGVITAPFRAAFNFVSDIWNNTVGRLSWSVPGWVPFIGGKTISVPQLPKFHQGGVVPGAPGTEMVAVLQAGERVTPAGRSGGAITIELVSGGQRADDLELERLRGRLRVRGGGSVRLASGGSYG